MRDMYVCIYVCIHGRVNINTCSHAYKHVASGFVGPSGEVSVELANVPLMCRAVRWEDILQGVQIHCTRTIRDCKFHAATFVGMLVQCSRGERYSQTTSRIQPAASTSANKHASHHIASHCVASYDTTSHPKTSPYIHIHIYVIEKP